MLLRAMDAMLCLLTRSVPRCGLYDLFEHHSSHSSAPDPEVEAFVVTTLLIVLSAVVVLLTCCPFLAVKVRRIRDLFWVIPSLNLGLYLLSIVFRPYPGGFIARIRPPGLWFTLLEVFLVLMLSSIVATLNACVMWVLRIIRRRRSEPTAAPKRGHAVPPLIPKAGEEPPSVS